VAAATQAAETATPSDGAALDHVIETDGLAKSFSGVVALDDLDLRVPAGSVFGYLGPNGAGKTTTIRILLGLLRPTRGTASVLGRDVHPGANVLERVGALVERPAFYPYLSAIENLLLFAAARGFAGARSRSLAEQALERTDLASVARRKVGGFSTGMRQRLGIALALLGDPALVILDEPTTGLDPAGMIEVRQLIASLALAGGTVFLSTHLLAEAEQICTDVAVINRGRVVAAGRTADLFARGQHVWLRFASEADAGAAIAALRAVGVEAVPDGAWTAILPAEADGARALRHLAAAAIFPAEAVVRRPSLEELYIELTDEPAGAATA
jgi:ABC-type multidrug transport system ATPase subunit